MGLADQVSGLKIGIDTAPFIYFIERHITYSGILRPVFCEIDAGNIEAITSTITILEVLVHPFRTGNEDLAERYREILLHSRGITTIEIINEISEIAARLRAKHSIKAPDALQIGASIFTGPHAFLTNDSDLKRVSDIRVLVLDDFIA